mgnify:CR=1 FL=1
MTAQFNELIMAAQTAGLAAGNAAHCTAMAVGTAIGLSNTIDESKPVYVLNDGVCGFAWVSFKGNTPFGRYMKKVGQARKAYGGGLQVWVGAFGQSMTRKEAYASAYAATLRAAGIDAYSDSRMD